MRLLVRPQRLAVRHSTPQEARSLADIMRILDERKESILLSPNYHIWKVDEQGQLVKVPEEERKRIEADESRYTIFPGDRLYAIQDASGEWYYPSTSGFTVGWGRTKDEHAGPDNRVYFKGYFPAEMVRDGDQMRPVRQMPSGVNVVEVNMRIDPDDVDPYLFQQWVKRLGKNKPGYDEETGTYTGPPGEFPF